MRFAVVALALAVIVGCSGKKDSDVSNQPVVVHTGGSAAVPNVPGLEICNLGARVIGDVSCGSAMTPKDMKMTSKAFQGLISTAADGRADKDSLEDTCAQMLAVLDQQATKNGCALSMTDADRARVHDRLQKWYGRRTDVTPTGDAAADAVMTKIAQIRDAMCACTDMTCLNTVDKQIAAIGGLGSNAPQAARDLGGKLYDDIGRCEKRIQLGITP